MKKDIRLIERKKIRLLKIYLQENIGHELLNPKKVREASNEIKKFKA